MHAMKTEESREDMLVARLQLGDGSALEEMIQKYAGRLRKVAMDIVHNLDDADEIVYQSLWKAYQSAPQYRQSAALFTWLVSITRNQSLSLIRHRAVELRTQTAFQVLEGRRIPPPTPEQMLFGQEVAELCQESIECLMPSLRAIVIMRLREERSNAEIAKHLNISVNAVKLRYSRGFRQLCALLGGKLDRQAPPMGRMKKAG